MQFASKYCLKPIYYTKFSRNKYRKRYRVNQKEPKYIPNFDFEGDPDPYPPPPAIDEDLQQIIDQHYKGEVKKTTFEIPETPYAQNEFVTYQGEKDKTDLYLRDILEGRGLDWGEPSKYWQVLDIYDRKKAKEEQKEKPLEQVIDINTTETGTDNYLLNQATEKEKNFQELRQQLLKQAEQRSQYLPSREQKKKQFRGDKDIKHLFPSTRQEVFEEYSYVDIEMKDIEVSIKMFPNEKADLNQFFYRNKGDANWKKPEIQGPIPKKAHHYEILHWQDNFWGDEMERPPQPPEHDTLRLHFVRIAKLKWALDPEDEEVELDLNQLWAFDNSEKVLKYIKPFEPHRPFQPRKPRRNATQEQITNYRWAMQDYQIAMEEYMKFRMIRMRPEENYYALWDKRQYPHREQIVKNHEKPDWYPLDLGLEMLDYNRSQELQQANEQQQEQQQQIRSERAESVDQDMIDLSQERYEEDINAEDSDLPEADYQ